MIESDFSARTIDVDTEVAGFSDRFGEEPVSRIDEVTVHTQPHISVLPD